MKMYERFIKPKTEIELEFEKFCNEHNICPSKIRGDTQKAPYPSLRKKFSKDVYHKIIVTHQEIADVLARRRETITNYLNGYSEVNYRK